MSLSKYGSQTETANLARLIQIIVGPCSDTLRAILTKNINPHDLRKEINIYVAQKKNPQVSKEQKQLIDGGNYSHFDITLLYFFYETYLEFRNIQTDGVIAQIQQIKVCQQT